MIYRYIIVKYFKINNNKAINCNINNNANNSIHNLIINMNKILILLIQLKSLR